MDETSQRLDKWLWFARIVKTRADAAALVAAGHVRLNRAKVLKPGHDVAPGDHLTVALRGGVRVLRITGLAPRRGGAAHARLLYEDLASPGGNTATSEKEDATSVGNC